MKREDFIKILDSHFDICRKIINNNGRCEYINCLTCPFPSTNNVKGIKCVKLYSCSHVPSFEGDPKLLESCKEFLKFESKSQQNVDNKYVNGTEAIKALEDGCFLLGDNKFRSVILSYNKDKRCLKVQGEGRMIGLGEIFEPKEWIKCKILDGYLALTILICNPIKAIIKDIHDGSIYIMSQNIIKIISWDIEGNKMVGEKYISNKEKLMNFLDSEYIIISHNNNCEIEWR